MVFAADLTKSSLAYLSSNLEKVVPSWPGFTFFCGLLEYKGKDLTNQIAC